MRGRRSVRLLRHEHRSPVKNAGERDPDQRSGWLTVGVTAGVLIVGAAAMAMGTSSPILYATATSQPKTSATSSGSDSATSSPTISSPTISSSTNSSPADGSSQPGSGADLESQPADSSNPGAPSSPTEPVEVGPGTATVGRDELVETRRFSGKVTYGDPWQLPTTATGVVTEAPTVGASLALDTVVLRIGDQPVVLAEGAMPMYRTLERVNTKRRDKYGTRLTLQKGDDVAQLQAYLISQGFTAKGKLTADGVFTSVTTVAVKEWQKASGLPISGKVDSAQMIFSATPLRVAETIRPGSKFNGLKVTDTNPAVWVTTSGKDRAMFKIDQEVTIEQPDGTIVTGKVTRQERSTADDGTQNWKSKITPDEPLALDVESVSVETSRVVADESLVVPTGALVALAEGGFAVEVIDGSETHLVAVEVIEVFEDRAAIDGEVEVGTEVVTAK